MTLLETHHQQKLLRMLAAFEADLPKHYLGRWRIEIHPRPIVIEKDGHWIESHSAFSVRGFASCLRCGKRFEIPHIANFSFSDESDRDARVQAAKEWTMREADRDGPCWGGVPELRGADVLTVT